MITFISSSQTRVSMWGNLKLINGVWKFKAIGYDPNGDVIPGGGPLTDRHNATFVALDEALIGASLAPT